MTPAELEVNRLKGQLAEKDAIIADLSARIALTVMPQNPENVDDVLAAQEAAREGAHEQFKIGDIVRFTLESGNDQTRTFTIDEWFWRLRELPGSLFLAANFELAPPKPNDSAPPTPADNSAGSSSPTPEAVADEATASAVPDEPVAEQVVEEPAPEASPAEQDLAEAKQQAQAELAAADGSEAA